MRLPYGVKIDNMGEPSMLISINNMTYEEHIEHFKNWYVNHKNHTKWQHWLNEYKINNEDIVLQYAKETNVIKTDKEIIDYWTGEFQCEDILD